MTRKKVLIIDLDTGNIHSLAKAFETLNCRISIGLDSSHFAKNDFIVLPGQGAFFNCYNKLKTIEGMMENLSKAVFDDKKPFLGVCVGMELMADIGYEHKICSGLGWIGGSVEKITSNKSYKLKIPHIGWNKVDFLNNTPFKKCLDLSQNNHNFYYFAHSYYFNLNSQSDCIASSEYGLKFPSVILRENLLGCQFHPEKSSKAGLIFLDEFLTTL